MAQVLLTHPYHLSLDPREAALGKPYPPLATMVLASMLREAGHTVRFYDPMFATSEAEFSAVVHSAAADGFSLVCIVADEHSVQMKQCLNRIREAALEMGAAAKRAGLTVLQSGPDVSDNPEVFLQAADAVVVGEPLDAVVEWVAADERVDGVHGLRGAGGRRALIKDLDRLPMPAWDLVDLDSYRDLWRAKHGYWEMNVWTARGCPYRCNWCAKPTWGRSYHVRSAELIADELALLRQRYSPDRIWFTDDIFALRPRWLKAFAAAVSKHKELPISYRCLSRVDLMKDPEFTARLAETGCKEVWVGAESGSDAVLKAMDKDAGVDEIRRARTLLKDHGVAVGFFLQLGYPGETLDDVLATARMVRELRPEQIGVSVSYPLPNTRFRDLVAETMKKEHWEASMDNTALFEAPFSDGFYKMAREVMRSEHSAGRVAETWSSFISGPSARSARQLMGSSWHTLRRPVVHAWMRTMAKPNPDAVPLTWPDGTAA